MQVYRLRAATGGARQPAARVEGRRLSDNLLSRNPEYGYQNL